MEPSAVSCKQPGGGLLWVQPERKSFPRAVLWSSPTESSAPVHHACTGFQDCWGQQRGTLLPTCLLQIVIHSVHGSCWGICVPGTQGAGSVAQEVQGMLGGALGGTGTMESWISTLRSWGSLFHLQPFQDGPKPTAGGLHLHLSNQGSPSIETFDAPKLSSLRSSNVVSQEIPTVQVVNERKGKAVRF